MTRAPSDPVFAHAGLAADNVVIGAGTCAGADVSCLLATRQEARSTRSPPRARILRPRRPPAFRATITPY